MMLSTLHLAPSDPRMLLGRERLLTSLAAQLVGTRLLTLIGPGGVGKTRVARELIRGRDAQWVDLAPLADAAFVPQAVVAACGLAEQRGQSWLEMLIDELRERDGLLVLDTCEHLRAACADLCATLLHACPQLTILATSRVPLTAPDETCCAVPPLDNVSAAQLFAARASARVPDFTLNQATQPLVAQICARLDDLPLAIELAAARTSLLTAAQIAERLAQSLRLLAARDPDLPPRQRSLQATLDWSYALLSDAEQALFRRLAVFSGSFDFDAVEAVCDLPDALDLLAALVDTSLVTIATRDETGVARYRLHDVARQYAAGQLAAAGEAERFRARQLAWALALSERVEPELSGANQAAVLARLTPDQENIRTALQTAEHMRDAESMLRLSGALMQFWNTASLSEGRVWLQRALRLAGDHASIPSVKAWNMESFLAYRQGDYDGMKTAADTALRQGMRLEHVKGIADAYYRLGIYGEMKGELAQSREHYEQSLALYQQFQSRRGISNSLNGLAHVAKLEHKIAEARGYYEQGLALARQADDRRTIMLLLISLANLLLGSEEPTSAEPLFAESLAHLRALGETSYLPYVASGLGDVARYRGDLDAAVAHYEQAQRDARAVKLDGMAGQLLLKLGTAVIEAGDYPRAARDLSEGLQIYVREGRTQRIVIAIHLCATCIQRLGYPTQAVTLFAAGLHALATDDFEYLGPLDAVVCTNAFASARAALTPAAYEAALAAGYALTLEQTVELARSAIHLAPRAAIVPPSELQIFTLGALRVVRHGRELAAEDWIYGKTRELLLYLLHVDSADRRCATAGEK